MKLSGCLTLFATLWAPAKANDVCLMLYQMADNGLEWFIRQDNYELTISDAIRTESLTTWIYFDHRNYGNDREDIDDPLQNVFNSDGSTVSGKKVTGSQYLRWDHNINKMVVNQTLQGEQDGDDPDTIFNFVKTALVDCVAKNATEYVVVFSSHGGGFDGFGGDENQRRRELSQSNQNIVTALQASLDDVAGAPDKFDVVGFDSCLMQAIGAADEYRDVAKYILASEAVEPGHGWAYDVLTDANSALGLAKDIQSNFLAEKQGYSVHQSPKTLSIVDLAKFSTFLISWNNLGGVMESLLLAQDPEFFTQVNRARNQVIAFESVVDDVGSTKPSAVDIGSFLQVLKAGCVPAPGTSLNALLENTIATYNGMFVVRGVGPGTPKATGMHVTWPVRQEYFQYKSFYNDVLFDTTMSYATADALEWIAFMKTYYETSTPPLGDISVCTMGVGSSVEPDEGQLLINPSVSVPFNGGHSIQTEIAREVDSVFVEYGVDMTSLLNRRRRLGHLREKVVTDKQKRKTSATSGRPSDPRHSRHRRDRTSGKQRRLQSDDDYFLLFGGDLLGDYNQSKYSTFWDRNFYLFEGAAGQYESVYAFDNGEGNKGIPVIYLPSTDPITSADIDEIPLDMSEDEFIESFGGEYGFLSFSTANTADDGSVTDGLSLFTFDGSTYSETPFQVGGQIVPVAYVEASLEGVAIDVLVGGFFSTVIDWSEETSITVYIESADFYLDELQVDYLIVDLLAYDDDALLNGDSDSGAAVDFVTFYIGRDGGNGGSGLPIKSLMTTLSMAVFVAMLLLTAN